jgi:hypothetical protein
MLPLSYVIDVVDECLANDTKFVDSILKVLATHCTLCRFKGEVEFVLEQCAISLIEIQNMLCS